MGEFYAWAATGLVVGLEVWSEPDNGQGDGAARSIMTGGQDAAPAQHQRFSLRQRDGRDIDILLIDSGIGFRNGHAATAVWAAAKGAVYGHCIYLENHTTGAIARLPENLALIRPQAGFWRVAGFGFLATFLLALGFLLWLVMQRGRAYADSGVFWVSAAVALSLLFVLGVVVAKLIFDYVRAADDQKIWSAADKALSNARRVLLQKPVLRRRLS
jgi:hypothetical protein